MTWQWLAAGSLSLGRPGADMADPVDRPAGGRTLWPVACMRRRGPAVQSALYRTTLGAVMLCPVASMTMAAMGFDGLLIRLSAPDGKRRGRDRE